MTDFTTSFPDRDFRDLTEDAAMRLLRLGIGNSRGIDTLIDRLIEPDGSAWLSRCLSGEPFASTVGEAEPALFGGRAGVDELGKLKSRAKSFAADQSLDMRLAARAGYDLAIAAAIVHHGRLISTQKPSSLKRAFNELASAMPEPWKGLMRRAADKIDQAKR